jgi:hypothetical protein
MGRQPRAFDRANGATFGDLDVARCYGSIAWMSVLGEETLEFDFRQPLERFIAFQHSTASFTRAKMGRRHAEEFDSDLRGALGPFENDGFLDFRVESSLVWGMPGIARGTA